MRISTYPALATLLLISAPLAAQNSVQDFTLPEPTPTPTQRPQGPVDDTGIVPVGPRVIPTDRPTPTPTPTPTAAPTTTPAPVPTATPVPTTRAQPAPRTTSTSAPAPATTTPQVEATTAGGDQTTQPPPLDTGLPTGLPTPQATPPAAVASEEGDGPSPVLIASIFALLAAMVAAAAWFFVRRGAATHQAPTIEPPIVASGGDGAGAAAAVLKFAPKLQITSVMRSVMMVTVQYKLSIANRSDRALRDLVISADLVSAKRTGEQLVGEATQLPEAARLDRIGPHQSGSIEGTLQLSTGDIEVMTQGQTPMFVPLIRLKIEGPSIDTKAQTHAVGIGTGAPGSRLHPLPLNGPPGSYQGVGSRPIEPSET